MSSPEERYAKLLEKINKEKEAQPKEVKDVERKTSK